MSITTHATQRIPERTRVNANNAEALSEKVWKYGKCESQLDSKIKVWVEFELKKGGEDRAARIYGNDMYIYNKNGVLITVLNIPVKLIKLINKKTKSIRQTTSLCDDEEELMSKFGL